MADDDGRLFLCGRCRVQVVVCRRCDRGQIHCGGACSAQARRASVAAAGRRYQASRRGRFAHAARARRYRARAKIVTHQGSAPVGADAVLRAMTTTRIGVSAPAEASRSRCGRCGGESMRPLAYLTPKRAVAWKCLSLEAINSRSTRRLAPVAYASRSKGFFSGDEGQQSPGVLWVVSQPVYKHPNQVEVLFPPTLTAKLVVDRVVTGDTVRRWTDCEGERDLRIPRSHDKRQRWRQASSVRDPLERAIFRITRSFAMLAFTERCDSGLTQKDAWASVRTAIANRHGSSFFAHVDAEGCLTRALGLRKGRNLT